MLWAPFRLPLGPDDWRLQVPGRLGKRDGDEPLGDVRRPASLHLETFEQRERQRRLHQNGHEKRAQALSRPIQSLSFDIGGHGAR